MKKAADSGVSSRPRRLYALDGIRLCAALFVVAYHYTAYDIQAVPPWGVNPSTLFPHLNPISSYGWLGVQLFFLISGFVICMSAWGRSAKDFLVSRITRLYPAYWLGVLVTAAVLFLWGPAGQSAPSAQDTLTNLTMFQTPLGVHHVDGVYWTLWQELIFYLLVLLLLVRIGMTYRRVVVFCGAWMLAGIVVPSSATLLDTLAMPDHAPYFAGGMILYLIYRYGPSASLWGLLGFSWLLALHQVAGQVVTNSSHVHHTLHFRWAALIVTLFYGLLIALALGWFDGVQWKWLATAGAMTYPLYLLHQQIGYVLIRHLKDSVGPQLLVGGLLVFFMAVAWLVHRFVERPVARRLKAALMKEHHEPPLRAT
ncbi:acyltransferase family protein [Streptomyces fractus]|uniref:acyltransferase family protein n=1 Tax=Streptomyces fractus TaxID=641806 RepID=UPI003CF9CEB8